MNPLDRFEEFIAKGIVNNARQDMERAFALGNEARGKKEFLSKIMKAMPLEDISPNFIVESCYDILIEMLRARLLTQGFKSESSHEGEVAYMRNLGFPEADTRFMNELRYFRNGIKYYGKIFNHEYAIKVLEFMEKAYDLLAKISDKMKKG